MIYKKIIVIAFTIINFASCSNKTESETTKSLTEFKDGLATSKFKVWGNCEMCKETIEASLKTDGVFKADWNTETKIISVNYDTSKINLGKIQKNIAFVGYDNEGLNGDDIAYKNLHECCQYDRK